MTVRHGTGSETSSPAVARHHRPPAVGHRTGFGHQDSARQVLRDVACTRTRTMTTVLREPVRHGGCVEVGDQDGTVWTVRRQGEEPE